jgi:hypothetical protein
MEEKIPAKKKWVSTSAWRGYYTFDNSVADGWIPTIEDEAIRGKTDDEKSRIRDIRKTLKEHGISSKVKYTQTSNLFSVGWDVIVPPSKVPRAKKLLGKVI